MAYTKYLGKDGLSYDIANEFKNFCKNECNRFGVCKGFVLNVDNTTSTTSVPECWIKGYTKTDDKPNVTDTLFEKMVVKHY